MSAAPQVAQPPFSLFAAANGLLTPAEMDGLIADHATRIETAKVATGEADSRIRRSQIAFLQLEEYAWLYRRVWDSLAGLNRSAFGFDIAGMMGGMQIARYDGSDQGFYDWHMDVSSQAPERKISVTVQLSDPVDYDGGELVFSTGGGVRVAEKTRGLTIAFPSFVLHRVAPVTRGTRWSLVAWITGPRWR